MLLFMVFAAELKTAPFYHIVNLEKKKYFIERKACRYCKQYFEVIEKVHYIACFRNLVACFCGRFYYI